MVIIPTIWVYRSKKIIRFMMIVKSRKVVDTDWMIGKTIDEIAHRYSYPPDSLEAYMVDHTPYVLYAREIFLYDS